MCILGEDIEDVAVHGESASPLDVIPSEVNTSKFGACPVCRYFVVHFECC